MGPKKTKNQRDAFSQREHRTAAYRPLTNAETPLHEIREGRGVSQAQLAARLQTTQPNVARIESEDDVQLSTLARYVRALDGDIEVKAVFLDETVTVLTHPDARAAQPDSLAHQAPRHPIDVLTQEKLTMSNHHIASFREALSDSRPDDEVAVADEIAAWAIDQGLIASYEPRKRALQFRSPRPGRRSVFSLLVLGDLLVQLRWLMHAMAFKGTPEGAELKARLQRNISGWDRSPGHGGFPNIPLAQLKDSGLRDTLFGELRWVLERL